MHQLLNRGALAALLTLAGSALSDTAIPTPAFAGGHQADRASAAAAHRSGSPGVPLTARLTGAQDVGGPEVPFPQTVANRPQSTGDPDGTGTATMTISPATGRLCFTITTSKAQARDLVARPGQYYVNVHNRPYPAGAVRGQLTHGGR